MWYETRPKVIRTGLENVFVFKLMLWMADNSPACTLCLWALLKHAQHDRCTKTGLAGLLSVLLHRFHLFVHICALVLNTKSYQHSHTIKCLFLVSCFENFYVKINHLSDKWCHKKLLFIKFKDPFHIHWPSLRVVYQYFSTVGWCFK